MGGAKLRKAVINIATSDGRQDVDGWIHPPYNAPRFAVTPVVTQHGIAPYYTVTHVPTGRRLSGSYDKALAFRAVREVASLLDDPMWDRKDLDSKEIGEWIKQHPEKYAAARKALGLPQSGAIDDEATPPAT